MIRSNRYARQLDDTGEEQGTFATPTLFLGGSRLIVENLIVVNTAGQGPEIGQALALYAHCDETVFRNCTFKVKGTRTLFLPARCLRPTSTAAPLAVFRCRSGMKSAASCTRAAISKERWTLFSAEQPPILSIVKSAA
ncbi:pectinesterase family protein [Paenibacillus tianjinensis]|uniref:pectinesterase family protein n=1 Tax=Paenibacillus tianjinensis TaxID=2810347 RepID=UPI0038CDA6AA